MPGRAFDRTDFETNESGLIDSDGTEITLTRSHIRKTTIKANNIEVVLKGPLRAGNSPKIECSRDDINRELDFLYNTEPHPHIVEYFGWIAHDSTFTIVFPFYSRLDLFYSLPVHGCDPAEVAQKRYTWAMQAAVALEYVHANDYGHRDVKSENYFIDDVGNLKLADFGFCIDLRTATDNEREWFCGTLKSMSPETILKQRFELSADVFAYGVIAWEILSKWGAINFVTQHGDRKYSSMIVSGERPLPIIEAELMSASDQFLASVIKESWAHEPTSRPTMSHIVAKFDRFFAFQQSSHSPDCSTNSAQATPG